MLKPFLSGCIVLASWTISLFFLRFWKKTKDVLFLFFAFAFALLGLERIVLAFSLTGSEYEPYVYVIRLAAFCVILVAVVQKNRPRDR